MLLNIDPIYLSQRYGVLFKNTSIRDDLINLNIFESVKRGDIYISEIICYYDKYINSIEIEYTDKYNSDKWRSVHSGLERNYNLY